MKDGGLLNQLKTGNVLKYNTLTEDSLYEYLEKLHNKEQEPKRTYTYLVSDFTGRYLTAVNNNDTVELDKLKEESYLASIKTLLNISTHTGVDYDIIYMINNTFESEMSYGYSYCWTISYKDLSKDEYDDSYEVEELTWGKNSGWVHSKKWSDGFYSNKVLFKNTIEKEELFNFLIK